LRLEAEIEELYGELEQEELDDEKLATDAFATTANAALAKKKAEDLRLRQGKEIRELIEQLNQSTKENVKLETSLAVIMQKNNELIKSHNTSVKIVENFVKIERLVP
jgi:molybdopterin converting factor small subunit